MADDEPRGVLEVEIRRLSLGLWAGREGGQGRDPMNNQGAEPLVERGGGPVSSGVWPVRVGEGAHRGRKTRLGHGREDQSVRSSSPPGEARPDPNNVASPHPASEIA